jgi:predicted anti-sigma-YlaC factor YlaD
MGFRLDCASIERLLSRAMDTRLCRAERWAVRLHLVYCRACRRFKRELDQLRTILEQAPEHFESLLRGPALPPELRDRLQRIIDQGEA